MIMSAFALVSCMDDWDGFEASGEQEENNSGNKDNDDPDIPKLPGNPDDPNNPDDPDNPDDPQNPDNPGEIESPIKGLDFNGAEVTFAVCDPATDKGTLSILSCDVEEKNGNVIDEAIYERNRSIEQELNVKISISVYCQSNDTFKNTIMPTLLAGAEDFNIICGKQSSDISLVLSGCVVDLANDVYGKNYVDYNAEWWAGEYIEKCKICAIMN